MARPKRIISIGGGKGGVGKSIVSIGIGIEYASRGNSVVLTDLDLGAANLHTYLGIFDKTPSLADFILGDVSRIEDIIIDTSVKNLRLISGSRFVPGMANPAHWTKLKIMRHLKSIDADVLIIDLGAGVHYNTLDFFGLSDHGIIVTMPEPGAVMNAYGFLKASLFRRIQGIIKKHPSLSLINKDGKNGEKDISIDELENIIARTAPDVLPLLKEIREGFRPMLIINRMSEAQSQILVKNLLSLCKNKLGFDLLHIGNIPDIPEMKNYLLNIPQFLSSPSGRAYSSSLSGIIDRIKRQEVGERAERLSLYRTEFEDKEIEEIMEIIDSLDENLLQGSTRQQWKLRLFFKPQEVVKFLIDRGISKPLFYEQR